MIDKVRVALSNDDKERKKRDYSIFKLIFLALAIVIALYCVAVYLNPVLVIVFALCVFPEFWYFKKYLVRTSNNMLIVLDPEHPTIVDTHMIGNKKWNDLLVKDNLVPLMTSSGGRCVFATKYDGKKIEASWIHELSITEYIRRSEVYNFAVKIAEELYKDNLMVRDIPFLMGTKTAGLAISVYENEKTRDISTLDPKGDLKEVFEQLSSVRSPAEIIAEKEKETGIGETDV